MHLKSLRDKMALGNWPVTMSLCGSFHACWKTFLGQQDIKDLLVSSLIVQYLFAHLSSILIYFVIYQLMLALRVGSTGHSDKSTMLGPCLDCRLGHPNQKFDWNYAYKWTWIWVCCWTWLFEFLIKSSGDFGPKLYLNPTIRYPNVQICSIPNWSRNLGNPNPNDQTGTWPEFLFKHDRRTKFCGQRLFFRIEQFV